MSKLKMITSVSHSTNKKSPFPSKDPLTASSTWPHHDKSIVIEPQKNNYLDARK